MIHESTCFEFINIICGRRNDGYCETKNIENKLFLDLEYAMIFASFAGTYIVYKKREGVKWDYLIS